MFTHLPDDFKSSFYIKGFENKTEVGTVVSHQGDFGGKRYYDQFDWINFLKEN